MNPTELQLRMAGIKQPRFIMAAFIFSVVGALICTFLFGYMTGLTFFVGAVTSDMAVLASIMPPKKQPEPAKAAVPA